jgi:HAD superfamily hydrolase (TIGR01509 family)
VSKVRYLFIDNGGVMSDNSRLRQNWPPMVGEFFASRLGGTAEAWADANRAVIADVFARSYFALPQTAWDSARDSVLAETNLYFLDWLRSMCREMGLEGPVSDASCIEMAWEADAWIRPQARALFPGVERAIAELAAGFTLFTASDGLSFQLADRLGAGIAGFFQCLYGTDIVNTPKQAPDFHDRIFAHAGVDPASALVVDDSPEVLRRAQKLGVFTVLVSREPVDGAGIDAVIDRLAALPPLLEKL